MKSIVLVDLDQALQDSIRMSKEAIKYLEVEEVAKAEEVKQPEKPVFDNGLPSSVPKETQELIDKNLLEIFIFYCKTFALKNKDFDEIDKNQYVLGLSGFNRFCKDFGIPLDNPGITLAWKKASNNH